MTNIKRYTAFWGVFLIVIGGLSILSSMGLVKINIWNLIFPSLLVFWGLWMLFGMFSHPGTYTSKAEDIDILLDGAEGARICLRHSAGRLHIKDGSSSDQLVAGTFGADTKFDVRRDGQALDVELSGRRDMWMPMFNSQNWWGCGRRHMWSRRSNHWNWHQRGSHNTWPRIFGPWSRHWSGSRNWDLALNNNVPIELSVDTRFSETQLDLSEIRVTDLKIQTNMSAVEVTLPAQAGHMRAKLRDTMSEVKVYVPEGVAARIHLTGEWENVSMNENRFPRSGDVYQSPDYDSSEHKVEIDATSDTGTLKVV